MEVFVARQPIYNEKEEIFAYELLHRSNEVNSFPDVNGDQATADVIVNSFLNIGIHDLSNGKPCFINFTEKLLQLKIPTYFNSREIVVEVLETVQPSEELIKICKELKQFGYQISLDDNIFKYDGSYLDPLLSYADFIKVDFLHTTGSLREKIESISKKSNVKMIAEKVETKEDLEDAKKRGYHYFQGFILGEPTIVSTHDLPACCQSYYDIIYHSSLNEPNVDYIADLVERDPSLSFKLLRLINSPSYRPKQKIQSIRQAIVLLGLVEVQKWIFVLALREKELEDKESLMKYFQISLTRAKMCESIANLKMKTTSAPRFFMAGMFSLIDRVMGVPMERILKDLPLEDDIIEALNGVQNPLKEVLDLVSAVETAQWTEISERCKEFKIDEKELFRIYAESSDCYNNLTQSEETVV